MVMQLFHFDVLEGVRTIADATIIEKDEVYFYVSNPLSNFEHYSRLVAV